MIRLISLVRFVTLFQALQPTRNLALSKILVGFVFFFFMKLLIHFITSRTFLYFFMIIYISGFAANIYVSFVLRNSQFNRFSVTPYMTALTVCDTAFLTATLFIWLQQVHDVHILVNNGFCQIVWFTRYVCNFLSIW